MKRPVVELSDCMRCQVCVSVAPSVFKFNDLDFIEVADLPRYPKSEVDEAIMNCPAGCIVWEEDA